MSAVRKSTNSRHRKPPLRGGTMRYRADITKQRRAASVLHFCNAWATCCVRLVHAKCSQVMLSACALQQLSRTSTSRLQERLTSSRGQLRQHSEDRALFPCSSSNLASFLGCFYSCFIAFRCFWLSKSSNFLRGALPRTPLGLRLRPHLGRTCPTPSGVAPPQRI